MKWIWLTLGVVWIYSATTTCQDPNIVTSTETSTSDSRNGNETLQTTAIPMVVENTNVDAQSSNQQAISGSAVNLDSTNTTPGSETVQKPNNDTISPGRLAEQYNINATNIPNADGESTSKADASSNSITDMPFDTQGQTVGVNDAADPNSITEQSNHRESVPTRGPENILNENLATAVESPLLKPEPVLAPETVITNEGNQTSDNITDPIGGNTSRTRESILDQSNPRIIPDGCNVKNATCVPTKEELIASGGEFNEFMQVKLPTKRKSKKGKTLEEDTASPTQESRRDQLESTPIREGCNVKNSTCVPTRRELEAAGVTNVDFMQYKMDVTIPLSFNELISSDTTNSDNSTADTVNNPGQAILSNEVTSTGAPLSSTSELSNKNVGVVANAATDPNEIQSSTSTETTSSLGVKQIPEPGTTTLQTTAVEVKTNPSADVSNISNETVTPIFADGSAQYTDAVVQDSVALTSAELTTIATAEKDVKRPTEFQNCPVLDCPLTCKHGMKVDFNGCETCECSFSNNCPRVVPATRLLCLLRIQTDQSCETDADCQRNRICCPGTCGPMCRRESRNRSMLLSMIVD